MIRKQQIKCIITYLDFSTSFDFYRHDKKIIDCYISKKPKKLEYEYNEDLSLDGLVVCVKYNDGSILEVNDYKVSFDDNEFGEIKCIVSYLDYTMSFNFYRNKLSKIDILDISSMSDKTNMSINISDYYIRLEDILYGKNRTANTMIYFDESCVVNTNIYGYEVAVDKYGMIIDKAVNVTLPDGGFVLSAHGDKVALLKELNISLDTALNLLMDDNRIITRVMNRRLCTKCGKGYNLLTLKPKQEGVCDDCGSPLYQRADDNEETYIESGIKINEITSGIIKYLEEQVS